MNSKSSSIILFLSFIIGMCGFGVIYTQSGWQLTFGIFLALWGNNLIVRQNVQDMINQK